MSCDVSEFHAGIGPTDVGIEAWAIRERRFIATIPGRGYRIPPTYSGGTDAISNS